MSLTQSELMATLHYDSATGIFTRAYSGSGVRAGSVAGRVHNKTGHIKIAVKQKRYYAHRLAWLYVYGHWPEQALDHINGNASDNRIANLRKADHRLNMENQRRAHAGNSTGLLGASRRPNGRIVSQIQAAGRNINLWTFDTHSEAHACYIAAKRKLHHGGTL